MGIKNFSVSLEGRIKNYNLPRKKALFPLYEAVVNSLHAIEGRSKKELSFKNGQIDICISRNKQPLIDDTDLHQVEGFTVIDNGIGFNDVNLDSFLKSDSLYKSEIGGKGVGRFSWLKAFNFVNISSVYELETNEGLYKRDFIFSLNLPSIDITETKATSADEYKTCVNLNTYKKEYQAETPLEAGDIALNIMQHCLIYFLDENCPQINVIDGNNLISLNKMFEEKVKVSDNKETFTINDKEFKLLIAKINDETFQGNRLYLCANGRLVENKNLDNYIADLDKNIFASHKYYCLGILTGKYLDNHVDMSRFSFNFPEEDAELFEDVTLKELIKKASGCIEKYLKEYLSVIKDKKFSFINDYINKQAPQYRHLLKYKPDSIAKIKPVFDYEKLNSSLHEIKAEFDKDMQEERNNVFNNLSKNIPLEEYEPIFKEYVGKVTDANGSSLAEYVTRRKVIIELVEQGLRLKEDGKYNKEKYLHNLIFPQKATSEEIAYEHHNLWLIDERLSYSTYISSDIPFDNDPHQERTDLLFLDSPVAVSDSSNNGTVFDTIVIFELKRPMRNNYTVSDNPIEQLYDYLNKIRENKAMDKYHRLIKVGESTKYYLYSICDITESLIPILKKAQFISTPDRLGYYTFNDTFNAYFEILSYDKIVNDAYKRNRVLFEKLGI
jgi:hypothetical protein